MRFVALAMTTALTCAAGSALAADMRMPTKAPVAAVAQVYNWTGIYVGGFIGGAVADRNVAATEAVAQPGGVFAAGTAYNFPAAAPYGYGLTPSVIGGLTIGYNWQMPGSNFVVGLEGEGGYINLRNRVTNPNSAIFGNDTTDSTRIGSAYGVIAGRLGLAWDRALIYGKGGVAIIGKHADVTDACNVGTCGAGLLTANRDITKVTWALGGGVEWAIAREWSVKAEYLYLATGETFSVCGPGAAAAAGSTFCSTHTDPGVHTGKFGVNYHFNAPVVARY